MGLNGAGHWVAAARTARELADAAVIDTGGFRFAKLNSFEDPDFLPGGAKYDDLPGMIALGAPRALWLAGEGDSLPPIVQAAYRAAGAEDKVSLYTGPEDQKISAAVEWLLGKIRD